MNMTTHMWTYPALEEQTFMKFRRLAYQAIEGILANEVQRDLNQQCIMRNCSFALEN